MPTYEKVEDDEPLSPAGFRREDVHRIKELLAKADEAHKMHIFTEAEVKTLRSVIDTFETHSVEIQALIEREHSSIYLAKLRLKFWGIVKWLLATFLLIIGVVQGWQQVVSPLLKWGSGK